MMKSAKSGFTLAEVLTTLMVIGVVAAMTIPTLMNSTQEQQARVAFRKAMSVLSQGVEMLGAQENECTTEFSATPITGAMLANCMRNVLQGTVDGDELTTPDGMVFKFYANNTAAPAGSTLATVCGDSFPASAMGWQGSANCGVAVDVNGLGKGTKSFAPVNGVGGVVFGNNQGFTTAPNGDDQFGISLSSTGARPIWSAAHPEAYEHMFGKLGVGANNAAKTPVSDKTKDCKCTTPGAAGAADTVTYVQVDKTANCASKSSGSTNCIDNPQ